MDDIAIARSVLLKYDGTDSTLELPLTAGSTAESLRRDFLDAYRVRYGFHIPGRGVVIDTLSVVARGRNENAAAAPREFAARPAPLAPMATRPVYFEGQWFDAPLFDRESLRPGDTLAGPALICDRNTSVVL